VVAPVAGFIFLALSFIAWRFGIRHYTSTGS
jgi:ABC-2 type transport system permease protein